MKKLIVLVGVLSTIMFIFLYSQNHKRIILPNIDPNRIVFFVQQGCGHCHQALAFVNDTLKPNYPNLAIDIIDITDNHKNLAKLKAVAKQYHIPPSKLGTPVILYNGKMTMGWSSKHGKSLMSMIREKTAGNN